MQMNTNMNMSKERGNFLFDTELRDTCKIFAHYLRNRSCSVEEKEEDNNYYFASFVN